MSLVKDFDLHLKSHLEALKTLRQGVPSGLPSQLSEVSSILNTFDAAREKISQDNNLSAQGKVTQYQAAYDAARKAVEGWRTTKTSGIDRQMTPQRAALMAQADAGLPTPTDLQITNMVTRLSDFDPLEVEILYADATDAERRLIEAATNAIGRQPVRVGEKVQWQPLISPERLSEAIAARAERANPESAAQLRDLQRIRSTYDAVAGGAIALLKESLPSHAQVA